MRQIVGVIGTTIDKASDDIGDEVVDEVLPVIETNSLLCNKKRK